MLHWHFGLIMFMERHGDVARELVRQARKDLCLIETDVSTSVSNILIDAIELELIRRERAAVLCNEQALTSDPDRRTLAEYVLAMTARAHAAGRTFPSVCN